MTAPDSHLMTAAEVAKAFAVDARTVARWDKDGKLKAAFRTVGGHRRYRRADIEAIMRGER